MPISLYSTSIDLFIKSLESLERMLQKAQAHSPHSSTTLAAARLHEDMLPLSFQVQQVSNISRRFVDRILPAVAGAASEERGRTPVWEDKEATVGELLARVDKSLAFLRGIDAAELADGEEDRVIELPMGRTETIKAHVMGYALGWAVPDIFFHVSTAYAILRMHGVPLGKKDYLLSYLEPIVLSQSN